MPQKKCPISRATPRAANSLTSSKRCSASRPNSTSNTDLTTEDEASIEQVLPQEQLQAFRGVYLETAQRLKDKQDNGDDSASLAVQQLDFEFVLFASAVIDYDYIMSLLARYTQAKPGKQTMSREVLIGLIASDAKFMDEREEIADYIKTLQVGQALSEKESRSGYESFKTTKNIHQLANLATKQGPPSAPVPFGCELSSPAPARPAGRSTVSRRRSCAA